MAQSSEQIFLRTDIHTLSQGISDSNFNVRRYKRLRQQKPITRLRTQFSSTTSLTTTNFNALLKKHSTFMPQSTKRTRSLSKGSPAPPTPAPKAPKGIQFREIECWLNQALLQYCHEQYFDPRVSNSGLKKYSIDMNSLKSKDMTSQQVYRLYKGLSVYSMGFNQFIQTITHGSISLAKDIWRVYSLLLQYCAEGNHQTVLAQLERDKERQLAQLNDEVQRQKHIIQHNSAINLEKNKDVFRENKRLLDDNTTLLNEKRVLLEEYQISEEAFCEEVALRLKFEEKINEIYGLHRELGIKHHKLHDDLIHTLQSLKSTTQKYFRSNERGSQYKVMLQQLKTDHNRVSDYRVHEKERMQQMVDENIKLREVAGELERRASSAEAINHHVTIKLDQLQMDKQNILAMFELRQKSAKETHSEYQITLQENNRLYLTLSDQRKTMEAYEKEKKEFNSRVIQILAQSSFYKKKCSEMETKCSKLSEENKKMKEKSQEIKLNETINMKTIQVLQSNCQQTTALTDSMHKINARLQQQLQYLRKYQVNAEAMHRKKQEELDSCREQIERLKSVEQSLTSKTHQLQSQAMLKCEQLAAEQALMAHRRYLYEEQQRQLTQERVLYMSKLQQSQAQVQRLLHLHSICCTDLKNEKFQRNTLNANYTQLLKIIEKKNEEAKTQGQAISSLTEQVRQGHRNIQSLQQNSLHLLSQFSAIEERMRSLLLCQKQQIDHKHNYIHPMQYEDILLRLNRQITNHTALKDSSSLAQHNTAAEIALLKNQINRLREYHAKDIAQLKTQSEGNEERVMQLYKYEQQKNETLKEKLTALQQLAQSYNKVVQERTTSEREEIYKNTLTRKNEQIQTMQKEVERMQDQIVRMQADEKSKLCNDDKEEKYLHIIKQLKRQTEDRQKQYQRMEKNKINSLSLEQLLKMKGISVEEAAKLFKVDEVYKVNENEQKQMNVRKKILSSQGRQREEISKRIKNAYDYYR